MIGDTAQPHRDGVYSHKSEAKRSGSEPVRGGFAIDATFAQDGPERCSGLPVCRYAPPTLAEAVGPDFSLIESRRVEHHTPWGSIQPFLYGLFQRV